MNETIIEYDINYEEYLRGLFPDKKEIVDDILKDNLKHIIYSQIGRDMNPMTIGITIFG